MLFWNITVSVLSLCKTKCLDMDALICSHQEQRLAHPNPWIEIEQEKTWATVLVTSI